MKKGGNKRTKSSKINKTMSVQTKQNKISSGLNQQHNMSKTKSKICDRGNQFKESKITTEKTEREGESEREKT